MIDAYQISSQARVNAALESLFVAPAPELARLYEAMRYSVMNGGKRVRPLLAYAACEALGSTPEQANGAACAVELIHAYSLVHDDLPAMDDDDLRRGKPSNHKVFGEATAVLAGDALQALAFETVLSAPLAPERALRCGQILTHAAGHAGICGGQQLDLEWEGRSLDRGELMAIHLRKTSALIRAACLMGVAAAGGTAFAGVGFDFVGTQTGGELVEHAVHEAVAVGAAVALGELDGLVDDDPVGGVGAVHHLEGAHQQDAALDGRQLVELPVDEGGEAHLQVGGVADGAAQKAQEEIPVTFVEAADLGHLALDGGEGGLVEQPLVNALQREFAGAAAGGLDGGAHARAFSRRAISTAAWAQSAPLTCMRERAWSSSSVVRMPLAMGTPVSRVTRVRPAPCSLETSSKW